MMFDAALPTPGGDNVNEQQIFDAIIEPILSDNQEQAIIIPTCDLWNLIGLVAIGLRHTDEPSLTPEICDELIRQLGGGIIAKYPQAEPLLEMYLHPENDEIPMPKTDAIKFAYDTLVVLRRSGALVGLSHNPRVRRAIEKLRAFLPEREW